MQGQKSSMDVLGKILEEGGGVLNVSEVGINFQPAAEVPPLDPGGGIFLGDCFREPLGY